jgi:PIN domain nuclease of toxin-antitoxin system
MEILLDTHVLLGWLADDARLSEKARQQIADPAHTLIVSAATAWEVALKQAAGKLTFEGEFESEIREQGFGLLPITFPHAAEVLALPAIHRDPFARMLVAQARVENLHLLTADPYIPRYPANVIEA